MWGCVRDLLGMGKWMERMFRWWKQVLTFDRFTFRMFTETGIFQPKGNIFDQKVTSISCFLTFLYRQKVNEAHRNVSARNQANQYEKIREKTDGKLMRKLFRFCNINQSWNVIFDKRWLCGKFVKWSGKVSDKFSHRHFPWCHFISVY